MAGAHAGAVVSVEVFVKQDKIAPVRVGLKPPGAAIERTPAVRSALENSEIPASYFLRDLQQRQPTAGTGGTFNLKSITVVAVKIEKRAYQISRFIGIQTGPRQFELPPKLPDSDSAG